MRKYAIPKVAYVILAVMMLCLSIGYTYAYFSAKHTASGNVTLGKIGISWVDLSGLDAEIPQLFDDPLKIQVSSDQKLQRGNYCQLTAHTKLDEEGETSQLVLGISNGEGTVNAYCRIQIIAKYTPKGSNTAEDCDPGWVQLGYNSELLTSQGWFEDDGYYYYGSVNTKDSEGKITKATLTELEASFSWPIANQLYLDPSADAEMLGGSMSITLVLEGVQTKHGAYQSEWGVTW